MSRSETVRGVLSFATRQAVGHDHLRRVPSVKRTVRWSVRITPSHDAHIKKVSKLLHCSETDAAAAQGVPQVIAPGCLDMVNFQAPATIPDKFEGRRFQYWNPNVSLMRTDPEENAELGRILAEKANAATAPTAIFLPLKGLSLLGAPGEEFHWPEADQALFDAIKQHVRDDIPVYELDHAVNDEAFADAVTDKLLEYLG